MLCQDKEDKLEDYHHEMLWLMPNHRLGDSSRKHAVAGLQYPDGTTVNQTDACRDDVESNRALSADEEALRRLFN